MLSFLRRNLARVASPRSNDKTPSLSPLGSLSPIDSNADFPTAMPPPPAHLRKRDSGSSTSTLEGRICNGLTFFAVTLRDCHSTNCNFVDCTIIGGYVASSTLKDVKIIDARVVISCVIDDAKVKNSALTNCHVNAATLEGCRVLDCEVVKAKIKGLRALRCSFVKAALKQIQFEECTFEHCGRR